MDTETLGLSIDSPIWEFAAIRRKSLGTGGYAAEKSLHLFIRHHATPWLEDFQEEFAADYKARYSDAESVDQLTAAQMIVTFLADRPHIVGAVPNFDTERISHQLLRPNRLREPWHYHLIDIENMVVGYLHGVAMRSIDEARMRAEEPEAYLVNRRLDLPWDSDQLSRAVNVDPDDFDRHTAMGDVQWVMAQWDVIMGGGDK